MQDPGSCGILDHVGSWILQDPGFCATLLAIVLRGEGVISHMSCA